MDCYPEKFTERTPIYFMENSEFLVIIYGVYSSHCALNG
jgi:hypothetical protein